MKQIIPALLLSVLLPAIAHAEMRSIAIEVSRGTNNITQVSIHSAVEKEKKMDISVADAASILKDATGWGSSVMVVIVTDGTDLQNYISLLTIISKNPWLDLVGIKQRSRHDTATMILKHYNIEQNLGQVSSEAARSAPPDEPSR